MIYDQQGQLVASTAQEGVIRLRKENAQKEG
jgi:acyl-CoA thioesterase